LALELAAVGAAKSAAAFQTLRTGKAVAGRQRVAGRSVLGEILDVAMVRSLSRREMADLQRLLSPISDETWTLVPFGRRAALMTILIYQNIVLEFLETAGNCRHDNGEHDGNRIYHDRLVCDFRQDLAGRERLPSSQSAPRV
jgi:hypothetical protein